MVLEPSLSLQTAVRARLVASSEVTTLVPAANVLDGLDLDRMPSIVLGEAQIENDEFDFWSVFLTLHIWAESDHTGDVKLIAAAVEDAISGSSIEAEGFRTSNVRITGGRFLRDPDGKHVHAVLDIAGMLQRVR